MDELGVLRENMQPAWSQERSRQLYGGLDRRRRHHLVRRAVGGSLLGALACGLLLTMLPSPFKSAATVAKTSTRSPDPEPANVTADVATVPLSDEEPRDFELSDGSHVRLRAQSEIVVIRDEPTRIELSLERGSAQFDVVPDRQRELTVHAGSVHVTVLGTVFTVEREDGRVRVGVSRGKVRVSGPTGTTTVRAGQAKSLPVRPAPAATSEAEKTTWQSLSKRGDYDGAYRMIAAGAEVADASDVLMDAADAARLSRHPEAALRFVRRVVSGHAGSAEAPLAAFTSGQLLERMGEPLAAADAFKLARELAPAGSLAEDALAREVEAWSKAGKTAEAQRAARMYEARYPGGRWLQTVQLHVGTSP